VDARQLEYFLAVADHGSFNRAAASLHLAQPSLSQAIRNLERELGALLFHRIGRRIELTEAGRAMIGPARQVLRDLETTRATVESVKGLRTGRLEIVSMPSPAVQPLPEMVGAYLRRYPAMRVDVRAAPTAAAVAEQVRTGAAEIGLAGTATALHSPDVVVYPMARQRFVLLAPPDGPLRPGRAVTLDDLAGLSVIAAPQGTRARQLVDDLCESGVPVRIGVEAAHREAVLPLVVQGIGVALLTQAWADLARGAGALVLDVEPPQYLHISLLSRRAPLTPGAQAFLDCVLRRPIGAASKQESELVLDDHAARSVESPVGQQARQDGETR
jgi:DNA-binding transcriptional LysR family regulator